MRCIVLFAPLLLPFPASAQSALPDSTGKPEVLILGVYHMGAAGGHVFESEVDDILSAKRQAEVEELIDVLARFRPTRVAVEAPFHDADDIAERYRAWLRGEHTLTRNETEQIGFRLARRMDHETVHAVDADGEYPFLRVEDYAMARGHQEAFDSLMAVGTRRAQAWNAYLASHTVLEALQYLNSDARVAENSAFDYRIAHLGEPWNWAGPDLVADWFRRNIRIYGNILQLLSSPDERVLVVFGSGHLPWLRHNFRTDPDVRLRTLGELGR